MKPKLTPWFPAHMPPEHKGVYEVEDSDEIEGPWYAYWDGKRFGYRYWKSPKSAEIHMDDKTCCPALAKWRGLAEDPAKAAP